MIYVRTYFTELYRRLKPYIDHNGGNIIMIQIENEYGSYSQCDHRYLEELCDLTEELLVMQVINFIHHLNQTN